MIQRLMIHLIYLYHQRIFDGIYSLTHSHTHSPIQLLMFIYLLTHPFNYSCLFTHSLTHSLPRILALVHLKQLMRSLALKRTKTVIDAYIPGKTEQIVTVTLNKSEKDAYDAIQNVITSYVARQSLDNQDYTTVLGFLTRLRQACLDIRLVPSESLVKLLATARDRITAESATITLSETDQKDLLNHLESIFSVARDGAKVANEENEGNSLYAVHN